MADLILQIMFFGGLPIVVSLWAWFITLELRRHRQRKAKGIRLDYDVSH